MQFAGAAVRITAEDIARAAKELGVELAALRAVMAVESRNSGYDRDGRPIILFEPHVFWRNLHDANARNRASIAGLAYPKWGTKPYPKTSDGNYDRLQHAIEIDEEAAYRSISVGMGQVLGENYKAAGCASAKQMFEQAMQSEAAQLGHMLGFIRSNGLVGALQSRNWAVFARRYNGPGQVAKYSAWLEREYRKWRTAPDVMADTHPTLRIGDHNAAVVEMQRLLGVKADSYFGPATLASVKAFQIAHGLDGDGIVGRMTWAALRATEAA